MTNIIDTKSDPSVRVLTDAEALYVTGGLAMPWPLISNTLVGAIERLKSELRVALPRF